MLEAQDVTTSMLEYWKTRKDIWWKHYFSLGCSFQSNGNIKCSRKQCVWSVQPGNVCVSSQSKGFLLQQLSITSTTVPVPPLLWILSMAQVYPSSSIPARTTPGQTDLSSALLTSQQQSGCQGCQNHTPGYLHSYRWSESPMFYFRYRTWPYRLNSFF